MATTNANLQGIDAAGLRKFYLCLCSCEGGKPDCDNILVKSRFSFQLKNLPSDLADQEQLQKFFAKLPAFKDILNGFVHLCKNYAKSQLQAQAIGVTDEQGTSASLTYNGILNHIISGEWCDIVAVAVCASCEVALAILLSNYCLQAFACCSCLALAWFSPCCYGAHVPCLQSRKIS